MNILLTLEQTPTTVATARSLRERFKQEGHLVTVLASTGTIGAQYDIGFHIGKNLPSANFRIITIAPELSIDEIPPTDQLLNPPPKRGRIRREESYGA